MIGTLLPASLSIVARAVTRIGTLGPDLALSPLLVFILLVFCGIALGPLGILLLGSFGVLPLDTWGTLPGGFLESEGISL